MNQFKHIVIFLLSLLFIYSMLYFTFEQKAIFWYLYAFTLLVGIAISIIYSNFEDELPTWKYLIFGIGYGTITYGIVKLGYIILPYIDKGAIRDIEKFINNYGPQNIWHYLLLVFIIVIGEEMFWRGYVQQQLKRWTSPAYAVFITAILFSLALALGNFTPGVIAAFFASLIFGGLYEWKKSMPLAIVSHIVFVILIFLVLPLT